MLIKNLIIQLVQKLLNRKATTNHKNSVTIFDIDIHINEKDSKH